MEFNDNARLDSSQVQGGGGGGAGGKIAVGGIGGLVVLLLALFLGIDPSSILGAGEQPTTTTTGTSNPYTTCTQGSDIRKNQECRWVAYANTINGYWATVVDGYQPATTKTFTGQISTGCGTATSAVGPFYCPADRTVYLDTSFFAELTSRFGAQGGQAAEFYVIAHEYGHHIQNLVGTMDKVQQAGQQSGPTSPSVRLELQADCYGGAALKHSTDDPNSPVKSFTQDDLNRALDAAQAVGDDRIQQRSAGRVDRESWTHGSSANRKYWLGTGFSTGQPNQCRTFDANAPQIG